MNADAETNLDPGPTPLCMPRQLWDRLPDSRRLVFERAQAILDCLEEPRTLALTEACKRVGEPLGDLVVAFRLLRVMGLIDLGEGSQVILLALPLEPVQVPRPDGTSRWMFLSQPLDRFPAAETLN